MYSARLGRYAIRKQMSIGGFRLARVARTDEEIKAVTKDVVLGNIFTSLSLPPSAIDLLGTIFMPISFGALAEYTKEEIDDIGSIYAPLSEALPTAINGYPIFGSMRILSKEETDRLKDYIRKYQAAMGSV